MAGIGIKTVPPPVYTPEVLNEGDQIEFSVTHEVEANGNKFWVKYGVTSSVRKGERTEKADERIATHVNNQILTRITEAAHRAMTGGNA